MAVIKVPIWKTVEIDIDEGSTRVFYEILNEDDDVLYSGLAYELNQGGVTLPPRIILNDMCEPYLTQLSAEITSPITPLVWYDRVQDAPETEFKLWNVVGEQEEATVIFTPDWSYEEEVPELPQIVAEFCPTDAYVLRFRTKYGTIDEMVLSGKDYESRSYERKEAGVQTERRHYANLVRHQWKLSTPFLSNAESKLMDNLYGSNDVWMQTPGGEVYRVLVTDGSAEVKRNRENNLVSYVVNVERAEEMMRR